VKINTNKEIIEEIYKIRDKYFSTECTELQGVEISRDQLRLSTLLIYLGKIVSEATRDGNKAYAYRKFSQASKYRQLRKRLDSKVKDSEMDTILETQKEVEAELDGQYRADVIKTLYDDCSRMVISMQSRLNHLRDERFNSNRGNPESN